MNDKKRRIKVSSFILYFQKRKIILEKDGKKNCKPAASSAVNESKSRLSC